MNLKDFIDEYIEKENSALQGEKLRYFLPKSARKIARLYETYNGSKSKMHPLEQKQVEKFLDEGYTFVGAQNEDDDLVGITVSRKFPDNYPYFTLPAQEKSGAVYTLGGLYVHPDYQGQGIAKKLSSIAIQGTEKFAHATGKTVGIGYEISFDNERSLKTLCHQGHYIGYYYDKFGKEGLSVLLYRPFHHGILKVSHPVINLTKDESSSLQNLQMALNHMGQHKNVGGVTKTVRVLEDGNEVTTCVINRTVDTTTNKAFNFEK